MEDRSIVWNGKNIYDVSNFLKRHVTGCFDQDKVIIRDSEYEIYAPPGTTIIRKNNTYITGE